MPEKVHIIGVGDDSFEGLSAAAQKLVAEADVLIGAERSLAAATGKAERIEVGGDFDRLVEVIGDRPDQRIVVLAAGDPLFYGTARFLCDRLGKDRFEVVPHVSSMQLAFARVKESWDDAYLANLATQTLDHVLEKIRTAAKVGLFTTEASSPAAVAQALLDRRIDYFTAYVCENLGSPDERVTQGQLADVAAQQFGPLNVMILVRKPDIPDRPTDMAGRRLFGNPDEMFLQSKPKRGLLTPAEVRCVALAELDLGPTSIVWDVGAGSGSVAVEAAQIAAGGTTYAIEMDPEDHQLISENADRFSVANLVPVLGKAPEAWEKLPDPDAIFVGGTGRMVSKIVEQAFARLRPGGRIVANVGSLDNVVAVREVLQAAVGDTHVWMFNISRGTYQLERLRFEAINPTFLLGAVKRAP
ncbi:MAG: precorrin-6y C5,15-methyltransferase (decarboxylating) subunit CbiE [Pirellulaceae bacterium]